MPTHLIRREFDPETLQAIGVVAIEWSRFEWFVDQATNAVLGLGPKIGRVAISAKQPFETRLENLRRLLQAGPQRDRVGADLADEVRRHLASKARQDAQGFRNGLLHGLWLEDEKTGEALLQVTAGDWWIDAKTPTPEGWSSAVIDPLGIPLDASAIRARADAITDLADKMADLHMRVKEMLDTRQSARQATTFFEASAMPYPSTAGIQEK